MKTIDELWKELEDTEFALNIAKQSNNEEEILKLKRKISILEAKIKKENRI